MASPNIDVEFVFDRYLGDGPTLVTIGETLADSAPRWWEGVRLYRSPRDQVQLDLATHEQIRTVVLDAAATRGPTYRALVAEHGVGYERLFGSAEFRGASPGLALIVAVDQDPFARIGDALVMQNHVTLQVRRPRIDGMDAIEWVSTVFERLCGLTSPAWGAIRSTTEYEAKVMSERPYIAAVGRDFSRFLPGLFSTNFFGPPYCKLIGKERLLAAPSARTQPVDDGVLLVIDDQISNWRSPARQEAEEHVLEHLGRDYFFSKQDPQRETSAPSWPTSLSEKRRELA